MKKNVGFPEESSRLSFHMKNSHPSNRNSELYGNQILDHPKPIWGDNSSGDPKFLLGMIPRLLSALLATFYKFSNRRVNHLELYSFS